MKNIPSKLGANDWIPSRHDRPQTENHRHLSASGSVDRLTGIGDVQRARGLTDESRFLAPITHESTNLTGLRHRSATISIGRDAVGTGTAGAFFICIGDQPELDFGGTRNPDGQGFAAFGHVTRGMELIRKIWALKTKGPAGSPDGELIASPIRILSAHRV